MTKHHRTVRALPIAIMILLSALVATLALGQGGTGRETPNTNSKKKPTPPKHVTTKTNPTATKSTAEIDRKLAELKKRRKAALVQSKVVRDKTPELKQLDAQIASLEKQRAEILGTATKPSPTTTKSSPVNNPPANASTAKSAGTVVRNRIAMELVWIPPGSFMMGSENGNANEKPVHRVTLVVNEEAAAMARFEMPKAETEFQTTRRELNRAKSLLEAKVLSQAEYDAAQGRYSVAKTKLDSLRTTTGEYGFYMGKYEVTQAQWQTVTGNNPSFFKDCATCPVEQVSWEDAQEFLDKLNDQNDGYRYRLPTEAEWEYACRAGTTGDYAGSLDSIGWYSKNSGNKTHPVGQLSPNAFGLYDMHGNVWEWCLDWYHETYSGAPTDGSAWLTGGEQKARMLRGGSCDNSASNLRSAIRDPTSPYYRYNSIGFRVVAVARTQ